MLVTLVCDDDVDGPLLFSLINPATPTACTHAGAVAYVAERGRCYVPTWVVCGRSICSHAHLTQIMRQLGFTKEGSLVTIMHRSLPTATYAKFRLMTTDIQDGFNLHAT